MTRRPSRRVVLGGSVAVVASGAGALVWAGQRSVTAPRFPVARYGAVSDGTADDSEAIGRASAAAGEGGVVVFPAGTTVWNDLKTWYPSVVYEGESAAARVRITTGQEGGPKVTADGVGFRRLTFVRGDGSSPFVRLAAADCWIDRCAFVDDAAPMSIGVAVDPGGTNARISNSTFTAIRSASVLLDSATGVVIEDNRITGQLWETGYYAAVQMVGRTRATTIRRNVIEVAAASVVPINGLGLAGTGNTVEQNVLRVSRFAIEAGPGVEGRIVGNACSITSTPVTDGLNYAAGISLPKTSGMTVMGNLVDQRAATRSTWVGIELPESFGCRVLQNTLLGSRFGSQGIILDAANRCTVQGNAVVGYPSGITVYGHAGRSSQNSITGNRIDFSGRSATDSGVTILLDATGSADGNTVTGNTVTGPGSGSGVRLDRQVGSGSLRGNRVAGNLVAGVATAVSRVGDVGTLLE